MNEDEVLILICYSVNWFTLILVLALSKEFNRTLLINLSIQTLYSLYFYYQLYHNSNDGTALVNLLFWAFAIGFHWLVLLIQLINLTWKKLKQG